VAAPKANNIPVDKLEFYEKLVATNRNVERKGASVPYTSRNGHMFSYLNASGDMALNTRQNYLKPTASSRRSLSQFLTGC